MNEKGKNPKDEMKDKICKLTGNYTTMLSNLLDIFWLIAQNEALREQVNLMNKGGIRA